MTLSSRSPTNWLDRRLDELALPEHGTRLNRWTRVEQREKTTCCSGDKHRRRTMLNTQSVPMGGEWKELATTRWQNLVSRRKLNVKFKSSRTCLPQLWCDRCVRGRGVANLHKRVTLERAESTLPADAFDVCFIKTSGSVSGVVADEGETCLVSVDVDTGRQFPQQRRRKQNTWLVVNMCAWCRHTRGRFERTHGDVLSGHTGFFSVYTTHARTHRPRPQTHNTTRNITRRQRQRETEQEDRQRESEQEDREREEKTKEKKTREKERR